MEGENLDEKVIAIMEFLSNYDEDISTQSLFSGMSFSKMLTALGDSEFDFSCALEEDTAKWSTRFLNFQALLDLTDRYFEKVHSKFVDTSGLDLIELCKKDSLHRLVQFFQLLMRVVMESSGKDRHIQNIMSMRESSQECFVPIIQNALNPKLYVQTKPHFNKMHLLRQIIGQFQDEHVDSEAEAARLYHANIDLLSRVEEQQGIIEDLKVELSQKASEQRLQAQQQQSVEHLEDIIEKLKEKMKKLMKQHQEQKLKFGAKVEQYQERLAREEESGEINEIYKEKYQQIMDQMQKMNTWKKEKAKMEKLVEEKNFAIQKLHQRIEELSQKNIGLEERELDLNLQIEQKNIKIRRLAEDLKKAIGARSHYNCEASLSLDHSVSFKQNVSFLAEDDEELHKLRRNNEKTLRDNRNLKKQVLRLEKKCQRLRVLEEDKKKLEFLVYQLRTTQNQELSLLTSAFLDGYMETVDIKRNLKHYTLSISDKLNAHLRRKSSASSVENILDSPSLKLHNTSFKEVLDEIIE